MIKYCQEITNWFKVGFFIPKNIMSLLSKKDKKYFLIIILLSLVHNLIVFPAQAKDTEDYSEVSIVKTSSQKTIIKKPDTEIVRFEQLKNNTQDNTLEVVKDFRLVDEKKLAKEPSRTAFKIASINNSDLPDNKGSRVVSLTAYNSEVGQTDGDPCTTANGFNLCKNGVEDSVAANFLPFGTKIMIPDLFGDKVFVVRDRMNRRFSNRVDVWMLERSDALKFGVRHAEIVILED